MRIGIEVYRDPFALFELERSNPQRLTRLLGYLRHSRALLFEGERPPSAHVPPPSHGEPNMLPPNLVGSEDAIERLRSFLD